MNESKENDHKGLDPVKMKNENKLFPGMMQRDKARNTAPSIPKLRMINGDDVRFTAKPIPQDHEGLNPVKMKNENELFKGMMQRDRAQNTVPPIPKLRMINGDDVRFTVKPIPQEFHKVQQWLKWSRKTILATVHVGNENKQL